MNGAWGYCEAYGCPLLGSVGHGGKWFCACHFNVAPGSNDAITAELHRQKPLVDHVLLARHEGRADGDAERQLIELTREVGKQVPLAPVIGPTSAEPHYTETEAP